MKLTDKDIKSFVLYASKGWLTEVQFYLKQGINVNALDNFGDSALKGASFNGHLSIVRELLSHPDININLLNWGNYTALMWASYNGHMEVVRELLKHPEIDLNIQSHEGWTALMEASKYNRPNIVFLLLMRGADRLIKNKDGKDAMDLAASNKIKSLLLNWDKQDESEI